MKKVIGILSGTSVDSVDIVLTGIKERKNKIKIDILGYKEYRFEQSIKDFIMQTSSGRESGVENVCKLNFLIGRYFADKIIDFLQYMKISSKEIYLIGSHGQTVYHFPEDEKICNISVKSTLQLGDPSVIANITGITTVGDFRTADVAVGGNGAPLVPYLDFVMFGSNTKNRLLINIGGISNLTYIRKKANIDGLIAFDTGPGNMLIDYLSMKYLSLPFDKNGATAYKGILNESIFSKILENDKYIFSSPPKSTGREYYNEIFLDEILRKFPKVGKYDALRTFTEYTCFAIYYNFVKYVGEDADEIYVSGGGAENNLIMETLSTYFEKPVRKLDIGGINSSNKEAVLFALLAYQTIKRVPANIKKITGAEKEVILGKVCYAN